MENKKGTFVNTRNPTTIDAVVNEAIPKHTHQHNTPSQHLRLLQYGIKIPNHQHSQLNHQHQSLSRSSHQHQPSSVVPQPHYHHRPQSPYQSRESIAPNIYQNQIFHHEQPYQYQQTQEIQQNHAHYQINHSPSQHSQNYCQLHTENSQVWVPHQSSPHCHSQLQQMQSSQKLEQQALRPTSPSIKAKDNERKKPAVSQISRFPTVKRPLEAPVTIQGWLHKQGSDGLMLWKKRWFVLSEYCLFYYKGPEEEKILGSILLPSYKVSICGQDDKVNRKHAFKCEHVNMRTYVLAADSQELMMQWVRVVNLASLLQNSNYSDPHVECQPSVSNQPLDTSSAKCPTSNSRNIAHVQTPSNTTDLSQQELNQFSQPLYANAPPKPRRLTSPSSEVLDRFCADPKYVTLQQVQHYNLQSVYMPISSTNSKSVINIYNNPQANAEFASRTIHNQINGKNVLMPEHQSVIIRESHSTERRTPDTYGRSKLNHSKNMYPSDYEDIYSDQSMYKRPLSPVAYNNHNSKLNSVPLMKPYTHIGIHGSKTNLPFSEHQFSQRVPNTIPRPHSADFLEYEIKHENSNNIKKKRPKSSLDINRHTVNDNYFYSEERYAEKMRNSTQYLPKMSRLPGLNEYALDQQKRMYGTNKRDSENAFLSNGQLLHLKDLNQEISQKELQPVRSRSVLSDGSLSKEVDMESNLNVHGHYAKEAISPAFGNREDIYSRNEDHRRSRDYDQFKRSASARLTQNIGQLEEKVLNREGQRKREESMKRLLEWKQRMLQSPLNRKINQEQSRSRNSGYYKAHENSFPASTSELYFESKDMSSMPQYNSYSSDDEEIEERSKENVQTQAGRTTDACSSILQPRVSALKPATTVFQNNHVNELTVIEKVAVNAEIDTKKSGIIREDLEKRVNTSEIISNGALVKRILAEFEQKATGCKIDANRDELTNNFEDNYMTMTPKKSVLELSDSSSLSSAVLGADPDENLYVEMTQGSHISILKPAIEEIEESMNEHQAYELVCFGEDKVEPVYMELKHLETKTEESKSDLPDILIASQNKSKSENKSDSSDVDEESSKYLDSLDTLYNPRFSLSDSFRPASYYLGANRILPELQDSSDSELVSPPPIPTSPPPIDDLDNMDESLHTMISLQDDLVRDKSTKEIIENGSDFELRACASKSCQYERMLKRRPFSEEVYSEFGSCTNTSNDIFDDYLQGLETKDASRREDKNQSVNHDYENMYISSSRDKKIRNCGSVETLSPITLHSHSRDNSRDTASSQITSSSRRSTLSPNDCILRGRSNSSTSILDEASEYISESSRHLTPVICPEYSTTSSEIRANSFYFFESKSNQLGLCSFNNQSAPYYYSDLSINTSRTDSSSSILTLNNQRSAMTGSKRDITRIINPIRCNNRIGKSTPHQNLRCKLAAEARSASVDFLNIADKSGNIDKKNIYESDTLKRLKITDSSMSLQDKSDVRNVYVGAGMDKFGGNDLNIRRSYSLEGLLENVLNENVVVPREFREQREGAETSGHEEGANAAEGSHLWEEDSIWHEQLRSASQRHTRSLDDLESIRELDKKPKKNSRGISRLVTYVNDNMFNMPIQDKHTMELEVKKYDSTKNGVFIIDREKLRQWDFLSSAPSDSQSFMQSPIYGCTNNTVVELSANVSFNEASEQNYIRDPASGSISITTRDTFPRTVTAKKPWVSGARSAQSKSSLNFNSDCLSSQRPQQGCYIPQIPSQHDISSDTNFRKVNWKLGDKVNAGELLGRTHEELVLLLIQLRRQSANNCNAIEACYNEIDSIQSRLPKMDASKRLENLQKLEQIRQHLLELEKQYEKGKPLVNLVDNMVKLGSLYRYPKDNNNHPYVRDRLVFNQHIQERRLLAEERRDWNRLSPTQSELQTKVQQLYQLDQLIQEESETLQSLQQDKEEIERTLGGLRHRLIKGFKDPIEVEQAIKQQAVLENELSRVHSMLAQNSRRLEETVAGNARLEQELLVLKQKLQLSKHQRSSPQISNAGDSLPCVIGTSAMLESDLHRVQQKVGDLQRQRQELSAQVRQLTDRSNSLQQLRLSAIPAHVGPGNKKKLNPLWRETDLDTMKFVDHGESYDSATQSNDIAPLYINTDIKQNVESDFSISSFKSNDSTSDDNQNQNVACQEKQEIKTVRIVKRESERRHRDREKISAGKWDPVEEEDLSQSSNALFAVSLKRPQSIVPLETSTVNTGKLPGRVLSRQSSLSQPSLPQTYSDVNVRSDKISELSPIFKSESAKQIIMEMSTQDNSKNLHRRAVPKEKRRHYTAPHNNLIMKSLNQLPTDSKDFEKLDVRRARDDLDMERALRQRIDAPDVVRSTLSNKELKYNESTIDNILGTPNKIFIPERYVPERLPQLTAEEQQYRLRKVESIKKMLSDTTIISGSSPNLASEETNTDNSTTSSSTKTTSKIIEEKKQREHLLQLNQILAKQVMEMSKIVAGSSNPSE